MRLRPAHKLLLLLSLAGMFLAPSRASAQIRKPCAGGITLKINASVTTQGSLLLTEVLGAKTVIGISGEWDGRAAPLWRASEKSPVLQGLLGVDLEKAPGHYEWKVSWKTADGNAVTCSVPVTVRAGKFPTERLTVEKQFVQPDPEQLKRIEEDQKKMRAIYDTLTPERLWDGKFRLPLQDMAAGGNFGRRRILNGEARSPHAGVDFPALAGTPVFASQSGKIVLAEELFYSGNTVVIDHGYGIYTLYAHLSEIGVHSGDAVEAGAQIGKVGATGRVTGPHLHWGLTIQRARVNALKIVERQP
ncbi:MAG TPA: M23 family metallopeptidase [Candidatus Limnocylindrales bacterium]|nr:M23 family metallopeptidase [Candidatus Limnocylindrales bacterium]